ncbi:MULTISPECIES: DUF1878 family protein [Peribacillus]|jgi:hypothetical protein|uniref:DUF1878 family protein n=1 Tax=Peribacillus asahii TaxID=228899 RepID=A0A398B8H2_9BACI|nr:DUF1878 family protein [Peribacillus asahii]AZV41608.1 hypothetical protein BAOM_0997 [Peribacillus asahii]RID86162.1 DUF1878 family protein [Peribacillus asahii]USK71050.1 YhaI family protein [Peribacillus asahii]USK85960.1 YhaI family protein [Peribacillus asahii]
MRHLEKEIETLRYHQQLLLKIIQNPKAKLDLLIVEKNMTKEEAQQLLELCESLSKKFVTEKAEGYMNFQPLFNDLQKHLTPKLTVKEVIEAFLAQGLHKSFMQEMSKFYY